MLDNSPHHSAIKTVRACGGTAAASPANPFSSQQQCLQKGYNVLWGKTCGWRQAFNEIGKINPEPILLHGSRDRKSFGFGTCFFLDRSLTSTHSSPDHGPAGALLTNFNFGTLLGLITHSGSRRIALEGNLEACCIGQ